ncbi:hypothetical protein CLAFUW4_02591 [Fulvia fulva]|uniref:Secreted protein n=1 Tax=Passalora fulva TaxID=5499 RepID=A0A9Q8LB41_PASFU|nr:uncharacterized protein CLAFUR5_02580 [Fulvia fulva]KAK4631959.1 hypothetical protein CLAFUR4_02586 [Fulvia fulva]KAK4632494.1 hypothetical protein CLAFUR0_02588 [Fulvia fulva]UJO14241.1 hypothetical protein CLAFUR5_02580 [Fulvia fulva]WPV10583.1 hypothetical protein CLAFUW4_02591 [Fulvia fulva]WPV25963.1 hypothetical protein CLAFUW7_02591 [Fulvia fulva]
MKTTAMLSAAVGILALGVQNVAAGCYGGENWPNQEEARSFVQNACYNNGGMFTGWYAARQTKSMCPRASSNNMGLLFEVQNLNSNTGFDLGDDDCYNRLTNEIFGCGQGGESTVSGWRFRADPGAC